MATFIACGGEEEPVPPPTTPTTPTPTTPTPTTPTPTTPTPTTPTTPAPPPWEWPDKLAIMTSGGVGLAAVTGYSSEMAKDTGMTIRAVPEDNTMLRFKWVKEGRFFCVPEASSTVRDVLEALRGYAVRDGGPYQLRIIWAYAQSDAGFFVRGDSEIKTIYDIKPGHKVVDLSFVPGYMTWVEGLLAWVGVDIEDVIPVPGSSIGAGTRSISGGTADLMFLFPATPQVMEAAAAPHGIRWLELPTKEDPEGGKKFLEFQPTATFGKMTQSPEAMGVWSIVGKNPIMSRADADPELVYHWAKWLDENYDLYKDNHVWNQYMTIDILMDIVESWFVPVHDGLIKYLKEKGLWTAAHDARQAQNIELITRYVDAYQETIDLADEQGMTVNPENEEWLELWANHKKQLGLPKIQTFLGLE
jgi:TRAP transporter TAXI family solute receptor